MGDKDKKNKAKDKAETQVAPLEPLKEISDKDSEKALGHLQTCVLASKRIRHPRCCETRYGWLETGCVLQSWR